MLCCVYLGFLLSFFAVVYNKIIYSVTVLRKYPSNVLLVLYCRCLKMLECELFHFGIHVGVDIRVDRETI